MSQLSAAGNHHLKIPITGVIGGEAGNILPSSPPYVELTLEHNLKSAVKITSVLDKENR